MAVPTSERRAQFVEDDRAHLHRLGYAQELFRSMGGFQNFAISFTIISILPAVSRRTASRSTKAARSRSRGAG
jgi:hypothetical protein